MALSEQQKKEKIEQQTQKNTTKRVTSLELEKILYEIGRASCRERV